MKTLITSVLGVALAGILGSHAAVVVENYGPVITAADIPDGDKVLSPFLQAVTASQIESLTRVTVTFELAGDPIESGFASDMFVSLLRSPTQTTPSQSDPVAILLNQVGKSTADPVGFSYGGWTVTLADNAAEDVHGVISGTTRLTGTYQPDGRGDALSSARPSMLSVFNGLSGNADWRLNVGDLSTGASMRLASWSLSLEGETLVPVPEVSGWTWATGAGLLALGIGRRLFRQQSGECR